MIVDYRLNEENRIIAMGYPAIENNIIEIVDYPEKLDDWKIVDGVMVYDPLPVEEPEQTAPTPTIQDVLNENRILKAQVQALEDRGEFIEDCIAEMAMMIYG